MNLRLSNWLIAAALALLTLATYSAGLQGGFFFDDGPSILHAPGVRMTDLSWEAIVQAWSSGGAGPTGRPVAQLSFGLNHYFSGYSPWAYKATNLFIHGLCAIFVYLVTRELFNMTRPAAARSNTLASWAVVAFWLLHPLQLLPVLHVVQRMSSLSALFLLAAFWLHIVARRINGAGPAWYLLLAWGVCWPLSVLSKESGLLLPVFVLVWELLPRRVAAGGLDRGARMGLALGLLAALITVGYLLSERAQWIWAAYAFRPFDAAQRLLTEARVLWFYVGLAVLPRWSAFGLHHDDLAVSTNWLSPWTTAPAVAAWLAVLLLIWRLRARAPLVAFGLAWFLAGHLMESTVLPLELAHEHRNYLPLLGLLVALAAALSQAMERAKIQPRAAAALVALALLVCTGVTALRAHQYGQDVRRTLTEAQHHPRSARAQHEAGAVLASLSVAADPASAAHAAAREHLAQATALDPNFKMALLETVALTCRSGLGADDVALNELSRRLRTTLFAPGDRSVLYHLKEMAIAGPPCLSRAQMDGLFNAARANPGVGPGVAAMLYSWQADYHWLSERDFVAAKQTLSKSLALDPMNPSNRLKWAQLLWLGGDREGAHRQLEALRAQPLSAEERATLTELLAASNITKP